METHKIHRLCNYNDLHIQFLHTKNISFNIVFSIIHINFYGEHLGVGLTGENPCPACARRWGNNLVTDPTILAIRID
jgi:hypothetical protein